MQNYNHFSEHHYYHFFGMKIKTPYKLQKYIFKIIKDPHFYESQLINIIVIFPVCHKFMKIEAYYKVAINKIIAMAASNRKTEYMLPPLREKIDRFSYLGKETIGKGFSSSVFRGKDDHTQQEVAIKIIDLKAMKGDIHKNLLTSEIQILSMIKNKPNLLDVHKVCSDKNKTYIITDFCEGGDLGKLIKAKKKLNEIETVKIIKQIIKGYQGLYSLGIVHRDLKPANIFFHNQKLEIGDFGFAVKQQNLKLTERYNVGSPVYMPPEALSSNKYSHKSDIWAIGVIFYEMLMGITPWTGRSETELKTKMKTISIRNIMPQNITKASSSFLRRALEIDVNKRMEPYQMFQHFDINYENEDENDIYETTNRLFRSMRKPNRSEHIDQNRGESMKKTTNLLIKKSSSINPQNLNSTYGPIPKTAVHPKIQSESMSAIQKRMISKHLLSQIHFCRFLFKLIAHIQAGISYKVSEQLETSLTELLYYKLAETQKLTLVSEDFRAQYSEFPDFKKLSKLVDEYIIKYNKKIINSNQIQVPSFYRKQNYQNLITDSIQQIRNLYQFVNKSHEPNYLVKQIIVLDYLITLMQLLQIAKSANLQQFHLRSKIQAIVDGETIAEVSGEHVRLIGNKIKALRIF